MGIWSSKWGVSVKNDIKLGKHSTHLFTIGKSQFQIFTKIFHSLSLFLLKVFLIFYYLQNAICTKPNKMLRIKRTLNNRKRVICIITTSSYLPSNSITKLSLGLFILCKVSNGSIIDISPICVKRGFTSFLIPPPYLVFFPPDVFNSVVNVPSIAKVKLSAGECAIGFCGEAL